MLNIGGLTVEKLKEKNVANLIPFVPEADFYYAKGIEFFNKRKIESALKWMKKALEKKPNEPLIKCQLAVVYMELHAYHESLRLLLEVLESHPNYEDCHYLLANNYAHLGLLEDAKEYAEKYLTVAPDGDYSIEAKRLLEITDLDDDDDDFQLADEDDLLFLQETAFFFMEYFEWEDAVETLEDLLVLFPNHISGKHDYAEALFFLGDHEKAIELELELLEEHPNSIAGYANLALFYYNLNEEEYKYYINNLLHVYPMHEQQKLKLAVIFSRLGIYEEAYHRFRSLRKEVVESHPSYYRWFAHAAYHFGKEEKARAIWKEGCYRHLNL